MKKLLFAITAIAFSVVSAQAQTTSFGLKAGMTAANMKFSGGGTSVSLSSKIGFYAGLLADIGISENFGVQPELHYSLLGAKSKDDNFGNGTLDLSYISLPILAKYKNQGFSAYLGPQIGYLISAKSKETGGGGSEDVKDQFKSADFSGVIGVGYTLTSGLGFDARYQLGLSDISKVEGEGSSVSIKNSAFMVGIHYLFNKK